MLLVDWKIFKSWPSSLRYIKVSKCMQNLMNETVMVKLLYSYGVLLAQLESHQLEMNSSMWSNEKDYFHFNFFPTWPRVSRIWRNAPQLQCLRRQEGMTGTLIPPADMKGCTVSEQMFIQMSVLSPTALSTERVRTSVQCYLPQDVLPPSSKLCFTGFLSQTMHLF